MAVANGRIPTSQLAALPASWSNKGEVEHLRRDAYESLTRALNRAVADTGTNFQIWDAYRSMSEQVVMLQRNYYAVAGGRRPGDRSYNGTTYRRRSGRPATASPGHSNHGNGLAVDIHPSPIQSWLHQNGRTYGLTWDEGRRLGEPWHIVYDPALDQMRHEGPLDHAWVQRVVGAEVDGKIGTGTVAKIREWQSAHGLTADGKVGAATKAAMRGEAVADIVEDVIDVVEDIVPDTVDHGEAGEYIPRSEWTDEPKHGEPLADHPDRVQTEVYIHYPGQPADIGAASKDAIADRLRHYLRDHMAGEYSDIAYNRAVDQCGRRWELRGIDRQSGANGGTASNRRGQAILVLVGNDEIPTADCIAGIQATIAEIRDHHKDATETLGHQESPDAATDCPGPHLMALVDNGMLEPGAPITAPPTPPPGDASGELPTGKDLLVALIDCPDFPLLRTADHRCYYGPKSGPKESVSGHQANTLNPGDVGSDGSEGLKDWQAQMNERGYSLTVDGKYGDKSKAACENLQRLAGITQDGLIGPDAWHAAYLLPVQ